MKRILLAGAALAALTSASYAADMPAMAAPEAAVVEGSDWSGFFAGVQGGYAWGNTDYSDLTGLPGLADDDFDIEGYNVGLLYGRNWQSGNLVFGLDSSASFAEIDGDVTDGGDTLGVEIDFFSTSRLKVGYAFDKFMVYAAGGFSLAHADINYTDPDDEDSEYLYGFTVGAGVEAMLSESWSARVEYLYLGYGEETVTADPPGTGAQADIEVDAHVVRGGVAYHF